MYERTVRRTADSELGCYSGRFCRWVRSHSTRMSIPLFDTMNGSRTLTSVDISFAKASMAVFGTYRNLGGTPVTGEIWDKPNYFGSGWFDICTPGELCGCFPGQPCGSVLDPRKSLNLPTGGSPNLQSITIPPLGSHSLSSVIPSFTFTANGDLVQFATTFPQERYLNFSLTVGASYRQLGHTRMALGSVMAASIRVEYHFDGASSPWEDLSGESLLEHGHALLVGTGSLESGTPVQIDLLTAFGNTRGVLVISMNRLSLPLFGATLVPDPSTGWRIPLTSDSIGRATFSASWPVGIPRGTKVYFQFWDLEGPAIRRAEASNALVGTTPR